MPIVKGIRLNPIIREKYQNTVQCSAFHTGEDLGIIMYLRKAIKQSFHELEISIVTRHSHCTGVRDLPDP